MRGFIKITYPYFLFLQINVILVSAENMSIINFQFEYFLFEYIPQKHSWITSELGIEMLYNLKGVSHQKYLISHHGAHEQKRISWYAQKASLPAGAELNTHFFHNFFFSYFCLEVYRTWRKYFFFCLFYMHLSEFWYSW